jgi:flagellar hook-associated protein 3 FlgL
VLSGRVTQRAMTAGTMRGLQSSLARAQDLQQQLAGGKMVTRGSDDPSAAVGSMKLRSQQRADEQYLRNIDDADGRLALADSSLSQVSNLVRRAQDLLIQSRDAAVSPDSRTAIRAELEELRKEVIDTYNTKWLDRPIFAGTAAATSAIDPQTGVYAGDDRDIIARVSRNVTMRVDVKGSESGADTLPGLLERAAANVTDSPENTAADQDELAGVLSTVLRALGDVGARAAQLETRKAAVTDEKLDFTSRISENEDVDLPKTIMDLTAAQTAYESALGAAAKVMNTSLMDFLR